jgi:signal transduction histidine kinase
MTDPSTLSKPRLPLAVWITTLAAAPVLALTGAMLLVVDQRLSRETDRTARDQLARVGPAIGREIEVESERLERLGAVIARDPKFFAVLTLPKADRKSAEFVTALEGVLRDFQRDARTPLFAVTDEQGKLLARALAPPTGAVSLSDAPYVREAIAGKSGRGYMVEGGTCYRVAVVPVTAGATMVGSLCLGTRLDASVAARIHAATGCDVAFLADRTIAATSIPPSPLRKFLAERVQDWSRVGASNSSVDKLSPDEWVSRGERYLAAGSRLDGRSVGGDVAYAVIVVAGSGAGPHASLRHDLLVAGGSGLALALAAGAFVSVAVFKRRRRMEAAHQREVERLLDVDRMRSGFLATAAREVLAPIGDIRTCVELIADGALGDLTPPQREGLLAIRRSADQVARSGCDLANMSLIDRGELPVVLDEGDVGRLLENVAIQVVPLAAERRQRLTITVESNLIHPRLDADCLAQAVMNLAVNAVRHTPEGGTIEMGARRTERSMQIHVSDTGSGLSSEDRASIEERAAAGAGSSGYRATTYRSAGLGLGLSVAFGIVEAHGGAIRLNEATEQGAVFVIELPLPPGHALGGRATQTDPAAGQDALPLAS